VIYDKKNPDLPLYNIHLPFVGLYDDKSFKYILPGNKNYINKNKY
jgi:hypothetical protein